MSLRVDLTPAARSSLLAALDHIRREDASAAQRLRSRIESTLERLESFPHSGRRLPEFPDLADREVLVPPYRFFYRVVGDTVWVVGVWHMARVPLPPSEVTE